MTARPILKRSAKTGSPRRVPNGRRKCAERRLACSPRAVSPPPRLRASPGIWRFRLLAGILEAHVNALLEVVGTAQEEADAAAFAPRAKLSAMATAALRYLAGEGALALRIAPQAEALLEPASRAALAGKRRWLVALFASAVEESLPGLGARGGEP